ncbi:flagellin, partial [Bdellovibrionota bacterium FG-2]
SLVQVAEGAHSEVSNILIRMRELAVQASSDTVGQQERKYLDVEFQQSIQEVDRIAQSTEFNRVPLLNGTASNIEIQVGTGNNPTIDRIKLFDASATDVNIVALGLNLATVADKVSSQNTLGALDKALTQITSIRAGFGATQNRLQSVINNLMINRENLSSANSRIRDTDMAEETSEMTKNQILMQAGVAVLGQANSSVKSALNLLGGGG